MKCVKYLLLSLVVLTSIELSSQEQSVRQKQSFNYNWKFYMGDDPAFSTITYNDSAWVNLSLPHDWSIEGDFSKTLDGNNAWLPSGIAWYRKEFSFLPEEINKHFELQFDGIYRHAKIWINGIYLTSQYDGYTSFYNDITEYLNFDSPNVIAIRVDNSEKPIYEWYTGSGIYRNVWLTKVNPLHIQHWGSYITTPTVNNEESEVDIVTSLENNGEEKKVVLETTIYTNEGSKVGYRKTKPFTIGKFQKLDVESKIVISNPYPWNLETPNLYTAVTEIKEGNTIIDDYTIKFGLRTISFDSEKGFFLNGKNIKLKGVSLHQDAGPLGLVVPTQVWRKRLENLKKIGCNAIRTAYNPASPEFLSLCDELGFLVMDEFANKWDIEDRADALSEVEWQNNFENIVRRDRNHPSVIVWNIGNNDDSPLDNRLSIELKKYCNYVRSIDASRPVISGLNLEKDTVSSAVIDAIVKSTTYTDLIAIDNGELWYSHINEVSPDKPLFSTESSITFGEDTIHHLPIIEHSPWENVLENDFNSGLFLSTGIDYLGGSEQFPNIGSDNGLLDIGGNIKGRGHYYQSLWTEEPMVQIYVYDDSSPQFAHSDKWNWPSVIQSWNYTKGEHLNLVTYANCDEVELYVNRRRIGTQEMADSLHHMMNWYNVPYKDGVVKAIGKIDGEEVCSFEINTASEATKVNVIPDITDPVTKDIVHVQVQIVDEDDNVMPYYSGVIRFSVSGDAEIIGITNANMHRAPIYADKTKHIAFHGKCMLMLKVGKDPNDITLEVSAVDLETGIVNFNTTEEVVDDIEE